MKFYSLLEFYQYVNLEMDYNVEYFCEQPTCMEVEIQGKKHISIPDFWVYYRDTSACNSKQRKVILFIDEV